MTTQMITIEIRVPKEVDREERRRRRQEEREIRWCRRFADRLFNTMLVAFAAYMFVAVVAVVLFGR